MDSAINVGSKDRMARIVAGLALIFLALTDRAGGWASFAGVLLIVTAYLRFCPAYRLLGKNTCERA